MPECKSWVFALGVVSVVLKLESAEKLSNGVDGGGGERGIRLQAGDGEEVSLGCPGGELSVFLPEFVLSQLQ